MIQGAAGAANGANHRLAFFSENSSFDSLIVYESQRCNPIIVSILTMREKITINPFPSAYSSCQQH